MIENESGLSQKIPLTLWDPVSPGGLTVLWGMISHCSDGVRPCVWPFLASTARDLSRKKKLKKKNEKQKSYDEMKINLGPKKINLGPKKINLGPKKI